MPYVTRDNGKIVARFASQQFQGQEFLADDHPDLQPAIEDIRDAAKDHLRAEREPVFAKADYLLTDCNADASQQIDSAGSIETPTNTLINKLKALKQTLRDITDDARLTDATNQSEMDAAVAAITADIDTQIANL